MPDLLVADGVHVSQNGRRASSWELARLIDRALNLIRRVKEKGLGSLETDLNTCGTL